MAKLQKNLFRDLTCTRQNDNTKLYHLRRVGVLVPPPEKRKVVPRSVLMASERQSRTEIVRLGKLMHSCGFVAGMDGNLSVRIDANRLLVTPTAMSKGAMRASDLVIVDLQGRKLQGRRNVSSEIGMHLLIYKLRPDIRAIVHAHPPTATGFAASGMALTEPLVCELVVGLGCIPLARYGTPGTRELADALEPLVRDYDAILMANHGVVAYAEDLQHAYMKMETVEHFAKVALVARLLGHEQPLSQSDVEKLMAARKSYEGAKSVAAMPPAPQNGKTAKRLRAELEKEPLPEFATPDRS